MGKKQKNNSAYNGAPTDKKETVYKNDTNDEYVYENGQYESAHGGNGYRYGTNRQVSGVHKTLNREVSGFGECPGIWNRRKEKCRTAASAEFRT